MPLPTPPWRGFNDTGRYRIEDVWKHPGLEYREDSALTFDSICTKADEKLFSSITGTEPLSDN